MEKKRVTTGLLAFPFVLIILLVGNIYVVDMVFAIVAMISLHEYFSALKITAKPIIFIRIYCMFFNCIYTFFAIFVFV